MVHTRAPETSGSGCEKGGRVAKVAGFDAVPLPWPSLGDVGLGIPRAWPFGGALGPPTAPRAQFKKKSTRACCFWLGIRSLWVLPG